MKSGYLIVFNSVINLYGAALADWHSTCFIDYGSTENSSRDAARSFGL